MKNGTKQENYIINNSRLKLTIDDIYQAIADYCLQCNVDKPETLTSRQYSGLCNYVGNMFFKSTKALFLHEPFRRSGFYSTSGFLLIPALVDKMLDIYIFLAMRYSKNITAYDFSLFIGIESGTFYNWQDTNDDIINSLDSVIHDSDNDIDINLSTIKKEKQAIYNKLYINSKESYFSKLSDNGNAIAQIQYGRSKGFISALDDSRNNVQVKISLSADDLPKLTG